MALPIAVARKLGAMNFSCATVKCQACFDKPSTPVTFSVTGITGAFADCETTMEAWRSPSSAPIERTGYPTLKLRYSLAQNQSTLATAVGRAVTPALISG